jgi:hypothetical protein
MVHHGQRLPLGLEALQHLIVVNPDLDEFQRDLPPDRLTLLRQPHLSHAAFADLFDQAVRPDRFQIAPPVSSIAGAEPGVASASPVVGTKVSSRAWAA